MFTASREDLVSAFKLWSRVCLQRFTGDIFGTAGVVSMETIDAAAAAAVMRSDACYHDKRCLEVALETAGKQKWIGR